MDLLKEYTKIIRKHVQSDRYGFDHDGIPKHANGKHCKGWFNKFSGTRQPFKLTGSDISTHLYGDVPFFMVNKPSGRTCVLCVDIDHNGENDAVAVALELNASTFQHSGFIEPSRHGRGAYLWVMLDRDTDDDPDGTNAILNAFSSYLRSFSRLGSAKIDAIKATLFTKRSRGVLATAPCFFCHDDEHIAAFIDWYYSCARVPLSYMARAVRLDAVQEPSEVNRGGVNRESIYMGGTSCCHTADDSGPARRARLFRAMKCANPDTSEDEFVAAYQVQTPDNNGVDDARHDFRKMQAKFVIKAPSFDPKAVLAICQTVPDCEFEWKRREKLNASRLADFVAVKLQDAFTKKDNGYFAMASRDATIANFRVLKAKGLVDWICTQHQYTKLLDIAQRSRLLEVFEAYQAPTRNSRGDKVFKGTARLIGPGSVIVEQRRRFVALYEQWKRYHLSNVA